MAYANSGEPSATVWIGNLPRMATEQTVTRLFETKVPVIRFKLIRDHNTKQSKCFGFLTVATAADALKLLDQPPRSFHIGRRPIRIALAHNGDQRLVKKYVPYILSDEPFNLEASNPKQVSGHVLCDDVLRHIFSFFDIVAILKLETVCRRWQAIIHSILSGRTTVNFGSPQDKWGRLSMRSSRPLGRRSRQDQCLIKMILMNHSTLTHVDVGTVHNDEMPVVAALGQVAKELECFAIRAKGPNQKLSLKSIADGCPKLKEVKTVGPFKNENYVADLKLCQRLEKLTLNAAQSVRCEFLSQLPKCLTELCLRDFTDADYNFINSIASLTNLKTLYFYPRERITSLPMCPSANTRKENLTQRHIDILAKGCTLLENFQFSTCQFNDEPLNLSVFKNLKILSMSVVSFAIEKFINNGLPPLLVELTVTLKLQFPGENSPDMSKLPPTLESLTLPCTSIADQSYADLVRLPKLKYLYLHSPNITEKTMVQLMKSPVLEELCVYRTSYTSSQLERLDKARLAAIKNLPEHARNQPPLRVHVNMFESDIEFRTKYIKLVGTDGESYIRHDGVSVSDYNTDMDYDSYNEFLEFMNGDDYDDLDDWDDDLSDYEYDSDMEDLFHAINLCNEEDKYMFGYGDPDFDGDYYLGHWD